MSQDCLKTWSDVMKTYMGAFKTMSSRHIGCLEDISVSFPRHFKTCRVSWRHFRSSWSGMSQDMWLWTLNTRDSKCLGVSCRCLVSALGLDRNILVSDELNWCFSVAYKVFLSFVKDLCTTKASNEMTITLTILHIRVYMPSSTHYKRLVSVANECNAPLIRFARHSLACCSGFSISSTGYACHPGDYYWDYHPGALHISQVTETHLVIGHPQVLPTGNRSSTKLYRLNYKTRTWQWHWNGY